MALQERFPIRYDLKKGLVMIKEIDFPKGWSPKTGSILYKIPKIYPRSQPSAYIPSKARYRGSIPEHMMYKINAFSGREEWSKWCINKLDWSPDRHTLVTMTRMMMVSLSHPNKDSVVKK